MRPPIEVGLPKGFRLGLTDHVGTGAVERRSDLLLERDDEAARIAAALEAARVGAGVLVLIEGPGGIGKTALLTAARRRAREVGMATLTARGSELELELALGVVRQLLEPVVAGAGQGARRELFSGAAALAAPIFAPQADLGRTEMSETRFAVLHGLYWLCANLAQAQPLLLAVDDAQWADVDSLRFLAYLANRLDGLPLAVVMTARPVEAPAARDVLERLASDPHTVVLEPQPLSAAAVSTLLQDGLGRQPETELVAACRAATGGTPFLVRELIRELRARGVAPVAASAAQIDRLGPRTIARAVLGRVRRLGPAAVALARATAVLGADATPRRVARLAGVEDAAAAAALDGLAAAGVIVDGRPIEFVHPIVRAALYGEIAAGERSGLHAQAARLLVNDAMADERVAAHVLATDPIEDPGAVELLLRTAREASARGAPSSATAYLERALAERPTGEMLVDVLHELGRAEAAQASTAFVSHLRRAIDVCEDPERRARIALDLGGALAHAGDMSAAVSTYEDALHALPDPDSRLAMRMEGELLPVALYHYPTPETVTARLSARAAQLDAGVLTDAALLAALGRWSAECRPPARRGVEAAELAAREPLEVGSWVPGGVGGALVAAGLFERAAAYLDGPTSYARSRGWRLSVAWGTTWQAAVALLAGDVPRAEADARLALEAMRDPAIEGGVHSAFVWACAVLIEALLAQGAAADAADVLADAGRLEDHPPTYWRSLLIGARGRLRLVQGDAEGALADALASAPQFGERVNPAVRPWRSDAALALRALGRAADGLEHALAELRDAREFAVPHAIGIALRAVAACSPADTAIPALRAAVGALEDSEAVLDRAGALVDLGAALRRAKHRAECQEPLRRGLELAHRCGAPALAGRARVELLATGARPRRVFLTGVDALTASERRVAELAAQGMTNRDIAQTVFVTQRTIETHLTSVFRKLNIGSRSELAAALAARDG